MEATFHEAQTHTHIHHRDILILSIICLLFNFVVFYCLSLCSPMCFNCGQPDVSKNIRNNNALQQTLSNIVYSFIWLGMGFFNWFLFLRNAAAKLVTV